MGEIFVEGLGVVEIIGDFPNKTERDAIVKILSEPLAAAAPQAGGPSLETPEAGKAPPRSGPLGIVPAEARGAVREEVEELPGLLQFMAEIGPAATGTLIGGTVGSLAGPLGTFAGGTIGGLIGEVIGQESGVAPASNLNLGLAASGPAVGRVVGAGVRLAGRTFGKSVGALPPARAARAKNIVPKFSEKVESFGTTLLAKTRGLMARPADELYTRVRRAGVVIQGDTLKNTRLALAELQNELKGLTAIPEIRQAFGLLKTVDGLLTGEVSFDSFIQARRILGITIQRVEKAGGVRLGSSKKVFAALSQDLDDLANAHLGRFSGQSAITAARTARLLQTAIKRAKLEFAVRDFEMMVAKFTNDIPGTKDIAINMKGLLKALRDITNPKSKLFDKNFVSALGDDLATLKKNLSEVAKIAEAGSPAGPGSIIIRGIGARTGRTIIGGAIGFGVAGPLGGGIGALAGASVPEMIVSLLTTKLGAGMLEAVIKAGKGEVSRRAWMVFGQLITRAAGEGQETLRPEREPAGQLTTIQPPEEGRPRLAGSFRGEVFQGQSFGGRPRGVSQ